jgi:membrane-associated HD superfamily phosphohydrolase
VEATGERERAAGALVEEMRGRGKVMEQEMVDMKEGTQRLKKELEKKVESVKQAGEWVEAVQRRQEESEAREGLVRELRQVRREAQQAGDLVGFRLRDQAEVKVAVAAFKEELGEMLQLVVNLLKSSKVKIGVLAKTLGGQSDKLSTYKILEKNFSKLLTDLEAVVKSLGVADFALSVQRQSLEGVLAALVAFSGNLAVAFPLTSHLPEYLVGSWSPTGRSL